jgi:hypothetical protein
MQVELAVVVVGFTIQMTGLAFIAWQARATARDVRYVGDIQRAMLLRHRPQRESGRRHQSSSREVRRVCADFHPIEAGWRHLVGSRVR